MGIGFLKNVYNMQTSLVPYSSMGHAMPLPTQILQESDSLLSNRKGSSQDCHRPDGAQGLLTRGFRLKPAGKSELTCILSTWSQVSQSQNLNISIGNYADKTRNGLRITNAPGTPGDLQLWTLFERADRYTCPEVFEGDILALGTLGVSLICFFFFLGFSSSTSGSSLGSSIKKMMGFSDSTETGAPGDSLWWLKPRFTFRELWKN